MIITKTPFRISFLGGGTDFPEWYINNSGKTISTSINKFSFIIVKRLQNIFKYNFRLRYYENERCKNLNQIKHITIKNVLKINKINNIDLITYNDLVAMSGIGSSSAFTVGLLQAVSQLNNKNIKKYDLALKSINVERNLNKEPVGCQDQFACSFGGFNSISYSKKKIEVNNLNNFHKNLDVIDQSTLFLYTNMHRNSATPSQKLISRIKEGKNFENLKKIKDLADIGERTIKSKKFDNKIFGEILNESWEHKKRCSNKISNNTIEFITNSASRNGAYASKVIGAGGGGFMIIYAEKKYHKNIKKNLNQFKFIDINFTKEGSKIILKS
mgnify:CR=1 FL=1